MTSNMEKIAECALNALTGMTKHKPSGVVGIKKGESGWVVEVELIEKESVPSSMDVLGLYEVSVDEKGNLLEFKRKKLRVRADTEQEE